MHGLADVELVERLDRLELDHPGADEPGGDDVLGHLGVRAGRHAERRVELDAVTSRTRKRWSGRGTKKAERGTLNSESFWLELGEDPVGELLHRDRVEAVGHRYRSPSSRAWRRAACSRALARISSASTRVGRPSAKTTSPPTVTSSGRMPGVKATCQGSIGSYDQVDRVVARLRDEVPAGPEPAPGRVGAAGDVDGALQDVGQPERLEHVPADPVRAERDRVREARRVGVADRIVQVRHRVVEDRAPQVVVGRQVDAVREQPVVAREARQAARRVDVADPLADVDVDADAEVVGQAGGRVQRVVGAGERGVDADQAAAAGPEEPLVLGEAAPGAVGAVAVGDAVGQQRRAPRPRRRPRR